MRQPSFTRGAFWFVAFCFSLVAVLLLSWRIEAAEPAARPNFLIILCDDLGYGDIGCFGNKVIQTPYLDKLAGGGYVEVRVERTDGGVGRPSKRYRVTDEPPESE